LKYLVDANVLSEPTKSRPDSKVVKWLCDHEAEICVNPIIVGEMKYGILKLANGKKRRTLLKWFEAGIVRLPLLKMDLETSNCWAALLADLQNQGRAMPVKDSLIAASALQYGLTVATRNVKDFDPTGLPVFNPF
jgi:toxin FitB